MTEENVTPEPQVESATYRRYCPICANTLIETTIDEVHCWYCTECEYLEPIIP